MLYALELMRWVRIGFSLKILSAWGWWKHIFKGLKGKKKETINQIPYLVQISFKYKGKIKTFSDKTKKICH